MPRWRQDSKTGKLVLIDEAAARRVGVVVRSDIDSFISPIDGTVVSGRKQYREHCDKHGVVSYQEFPQSHWDAAAAKRARFYNAEYTTAEKLVRKQELNEIFERAERNG